MRKCMRCNLGWSLIPEFNAADADAEWADFEFVLGYVVVGFDAYCLCDYALVVY